MARGLGHNAGAAVFASAKILVIIDDELIEKLAFLFKPRMLIWNSRAGGASLIINTEVGPLLVSFLIGLNAPCAMRSNFSSPTKAPTARSRDRHSRCASSHLTACDTRHTLLSHCLVPVHFLSLSFEFSIAG